MTRCGLCNDLIKRDEDDVRLAFDFTPEQLTRSAFGQGCDSCLVILEGLRQSETSDWSFQRDIRIVYARCHNKRLNLTETLRLEVYFVDDRPKLELELFSLQPHAWKAILPRPSISGHPLSSQALDWVQSFLNTCERDHASCRNPGSRLPNRVVHVHSDDFVNFTVHLVRAYNQRSDYVALSHCWGSDQPCITTKDTIEAHMSNVPWRTIPKTFQDAMKLALKLGFSYIWIDSLCIIQDESSDWEIESSKMAEIYQNAALTLAATSSMGDSKGCYTEDVQSPDGLEITLPEDVGTCRIAVRRPLEHWDNQTARGLSLHFPLLTRGWAFQERLLSARILHICGSELVWECREMNACECGGLGEGSSPGGTYYHAVEETREEKRQYEATQLEITKRMEALRIQQEENSPMLVEQIADQGRETSPAPPSYDDIVSESENPATPTSDKRNKSPALQIQQADVPTYDDDTDAANIKECPDLVLHFHRIVEQYSALHLSRAPDRLPALSGLCKRVQDLRGDYLAGLWSDSICFDLMWRVNTIQLDVDKGTRPSGYRGPSWSWVSVDSPVTYWSDITDFRSTFKVNSRWETDSDGHIIFLGFPKYTPLGQHTDKVQSVAWTPGKNPFGSVTFALLTVEASTVSARLLYTNDRSYWLGGSGRHDPAHYKLFTQNGVELPFFADYALTAEGSNHVPDDSPLTLLLVHPKICLVLCPKLYNGAPLIFDGETVMQRIGIVRMSDALLNYYHIDWMRNSEVKKFRIL